MAIDMRSAIREAASSRRVSRLPRLMFGGSGASEPERGSAAGSDRLAAQTAELRAALEVLAQEVRRDRELLERSFASRVTPAVPRSQPGRCWLFVPGPSGYSLVQHEPDHPLGRGDSVALDGNNYRVAFAAASPLRDGRRCLYLQP